MTASERPAGISLGLERIVRFLEHTLPEDPRKKLRVVHVAGTNGKGSVCALVSSALAAAGYRVGTFNSPHFLEPHDAVRIQNEPIAADEYARLQAWVRELDAAADRQRTEDGHESHGLLTAFEQVTALALWWFAQRGVDAAVVEVGMGGTRDATNVFGAVRGGVGSLVQCICPVDADHVGLIGNTVEEIAAEKSGIMRAGSWIVVANQDRSEAFHKIRQAAHRTSPGRIINVRRQPTHDIHVPSFTINTDDVPGHVRAPVVLPSWATFKGTGKRCLRAKYPPLLDTYVKSNHRARDAADRDAAEGGAPQTEVDLPLELPGYYQSGNASVAFYTLDVLRTHFGYTALTDAAIQVGFQNVRWPGRLSWLSIVQRRAMMSGNSSPPEDVARLLADGVNRPVKPADDVNQPAKPADGVNQPAKPADGVNQPAKPADDASPSPSRDAASPSPVGDAHSGNESPGSGSGSDGRAAERLDDWVLADGAHNEPAAVELRKYVDTTLRRISQQRYIRAARSRHSGTVQVRWVLGFSRGKDVQAILARLVQPGDHVWAVPFSQPKEMPWIKCESPERIAETARACLEGVKVETFDLLADAVDRLAVCSSDSHLNVVCGSLYLAADMFRELQIQPFSGV